jgi:hypothetical protein
MARIVIDKALSGDVVTARFCLGRLEPRSRGRAVGRSPSTCPRVRGHAMSWRPSMRRCARWLQGRSRRTRRCR